MSYVIAAYTVTGVTLLLYGIHLGRERRALSRSDEGTRGERSKNG